MSNLAYEVAVRGNILPPKENYTPYAITIDRNSPTIDYDAMKEHDVSIVVIEGGYLYDSVHLRQERYKNPNLDNQVKLAVENKVAYGIYVDVRARNVEEAKEELKAMSLVIQRHPPQVGLWLRLFLSNTKSMNNSIIDTYYDYCVERLGLKDQLGLYVTREQLDQIDWDNYYENWYLWLIDPLPTLTDLDQLLTPAFFKL